MKVELQNKTRRVSLANAHSVVPDRQSQRAGRCTGDWISERKKLLQGICLHLLARSAQGHSFEKEIRRAAARWHGRAFKCDPRRNLKLSAASLRRIFYAYQRHGSDALELRYQGPTSRISKKLVQQLIAECVAPGVLTRAEAIRAIKILWPQRNGGEPCPFCDQQFYRALPAKVRKQIAALHRARAAVFRMEQKFRAEMGKL